MGDDHPDTLRVANNLGYVLKKRGQLDEAESLSCSGCGAPRILGNDHVNTLGTIHNLAALDLERGRYARAETLLREVTAGRRRLGPDNPDLAGSLALLGRLLLFFETDRPLEAEPPLREALATRSKSLTEGHWQTAYSRSLLGGCLTPQKRFAEAEPHLIAADLVLAKAHAPRHWSVAASPWIGSSHCTNRGTSPRRPLGGAAKRMDVFSPTDPFAH